MENYFESAGVWGLFISAFISSTLAPGGSEAVLAYLVLQGRQPLSILLIAATVGNSLGAVTTWLLGAWTARRYPLEKVGDERKRKALGKLGRYAAIVYFLS